MSILKESWQLLSKPVTLIVEDGLDPVRCAKITMEPFHRGFGTTLGNALRRVLLSSVYGSAVTSVRIDNVLHEYSSIDGVKEDVMEILMNLKSLAVVKNSPEPCILKLSSNKAGAVFAGYIETDDDVTIVNKDLVICNLNEGASIDMQISVESGRGYVPASQRKKSEVPIGTIVLDAVFSPVRRVSYKVENARVGQMTDYDKLIITIETNGSISPKDALAVAAKMLQDQLQVFISFDVSKMKDVSHVVKSEPEFNKDLLKEVNELELSVRSQNCLQNEGIKTVGDLVQKTEREMLGVNNFGRKSLLEIVEVLGSMGLSLGMKDINWPPKNGEEVKEKKSKR